MMKNILFTFILTATVSFLVYDNASSFGRSNSNKYITIGTGGVTGVYYPAGGAICRLINRGRKSHGVRCSVESTGGSIDNINALRGSEIDVAVVQSDWQHHAYKGTASFSRFSPMKDLRSLFSLHGEPLTIVVRKDSNIFAFEDIKNKIVNVGNKGSGMRATFDFVIGHKNWTYQDFRGVTELRASQQAAALCRGDIDVMIYAAGHPNGAVQEATTTCNSRIIPVNDEDITKMVETTPYYTFTVIPGGMYNGNDTDVQTIGVKATFVTTEQLDQKIAYNLVKSVFDNFENFKTLHPVFSSLQKTDLIKNGNTAPIHKGAQKYFKEAGLIK